MFGILLPSNFYHKSLVIFVTCHLQVCATKKVCRYHTPAVKAAMAAGCRRTFVMRHVLVTFVTCHLQVCATKKVCRYHTPAVK
jgi:hypothetical protein